MPFVTTLPPNVLNVGLDGSIVSVPSARLINFMGSSTPFDGYEQPTEDGVLEAGDTTNLSLSDQAGTDIVTDATYRGTAQIDAVSAAVVVPFVANIALDVLPRTVDIFSTTSGTPPVTTTQMVTETPFNQQNIEVTATISLVGGGTLTVTAPISGIVSAITSASPLLSGVGSAVTPIVSDLVNTAALTVQTNTGATKTVPPAQLLCFVTGTLIETDRGMIAVQDLKAGDLVVTRDNGLQPIRWIGSVKMGKGALMAQPKLRPIRIKAGALGNDMPTADLLVSPQHRVLVRSKVAMKMFGALEVLVAAKQLLQIDGIDIADDVAEAEYFHFLFDRHEVVNSNGAATESLFTGPEALKAVDRQARQEIFSLFPQLRSADFVATPARPIPAGRRSRKLAVRHAQRPGALVS